MGDRVLPETANRPDWPRLVAQIVNRLSNRVSVLEAPLPSLRFKPTTAPTAPAEGTTYYDEAAHKLKCWDGTAWQDLW